VFGASSNFETLPSSFQRSNQVDACFFHHRSIDFVAVVLFVYNFISDPFLSLVRKAAKNKSKVCRHSTRKERDFESTVHCFLKNRATGYRCIQGVLFQKASTDINRIWFI